MKTPTQTQSSDFRTAVANGAGRHRGPNPGILALVFTILKLASLFPVTIFGTAAGFRPPYLPPASAPQIRSSATSPLTPVPS